MVMWNLDYYHVVFLRLTNKGGVSRYRDSDLAVEVAWVVVYLTSLTDTKSKILIKAGLLPPLISRLSASQELSLLTPVSNTFRVSCNLLFTMKEADLFVKSRSIILRSSEVLETLWRVIIATQKQCLKQHQELQVADVIFLLRNMCLNLYESYTQLYLNLVI